MKSKKGQTLVEMALVLPLLLLLLLGIIQFGFILNAKLVLENAVREGCRQAAVVALDYGSDDLIKQTVINACKPLHPALTPADIIISPIEAEQGRTSGFPITVSTKYEMPLQMPLINAIIKNLSLKSSVVMRIE